MGRGRGRGRAPCCDKNKVKRGPWSPAEDMKLAAFILHNGHKNWRSLPKQAGLLRCGKSCRLRWLNYLTPSVKRGSLTQQEEETILKLHESYGNRWSKIAAELPGRTDNEIKNVWNTHLKKRLSGENSKCDNNTNKPKNDEYSSSSLSSSGSTATCSHPCPVDTMPEIVNEAPAHICSDNAKNETSGSSSCSSTAPDFASSSTTQVYNEAPDIHLEEEILDGEFDIWSLLEDFEKFESQQEQQQQEQQLVPSHLQGSSTFADNNYLVNHDIELGEKSEWYKYLENDEIGLEGIIGEEDHNISENKKAENGMNEEMRLEPEIEADMLNFQYWPPSPYHL